MRTFIVTTIIALAAAKAKSQAQDKLDNKIAGKKLRYRKKMEANPVFAEKKHLI